VPDIRTIRYYTTLGLISPAAEMRGRTAYYGELHVLQIVAIKQLQAGGATLAEVQQKLVGLPQAKLQTIAKLPEGFWEAADQYLATVKSSQLSDSSESAESGLSKAEQRSPQRDADAFWLAPVAMPDSRRQTVSNETVKTTKKNEPLPRGSELVRSAIRFELPGGASMLIELPQDVVAGGLEQGGQLDVQALWISAKPLIEEMRRQKLIDGS
jgi:DNA-binding transcriptional MerR regulator